MASVGISTVEEHISCGCFRVFHSATSHLYGFFGFGNVEEEMILLGFMMDYCLGNEFTVYERK